ncbi:VOC family protein [Luteipulveratus sp. YIM 133132]|uniref:VOC family protein n=1 Tax=Luteipulveratus flavus TaxID=3031728 RepID=A0ABT6CBF6_9MICO|nr:MULTISPECIES: VOC family protein [unclassified Luteipulveratus]MDE9367400.1 VOC family protein [Luteipulveratus sp. YIM 133132]MDF8266219.1 VOC family protein [Luteipulveratus sp. YIM 133296]
MEQRINFVTLAVADLDRTRAFYVAGLGWRSVLDEQDVIMLPIAQGVLLSLWERSSFVAEVGEPAAGLAPITLAHNVTDDAEVDRVLADARAAGASEVHPAQRREWGGYTGYFVDPDGFRWEVAHNPSPLGDDLVAASREWLGTRST